MARVRLTERFIAKLTAPTKSGRAEIYWDTGQPGFAVYVSGKKASKVFIVQRSLGQRGGRKRREAIGAVGAITLEDARANALAVLHQLMQGADPRVERKRREAEDITLRTAMQRFFGARPDLSEPTRSRWPYYLERYTKDWLERPLKQITPALLEQRRQAIAAENRAPIPQAPSAQEQCFRFSSRSGASRPSNSRCPDYLQSRCARTRLASVDASNAEARGRRAETRSYHSGIQAAALSCRADAVAEGAARLPSGPAVYGCAPR